MPKRKAVRGKRGGGSAGRKAAQAAASKTDETEKPLDVNSSQETAFGLESEEDPEAADEDPAQEQFIDKKGPAEHVLDNESSELNKSSNKEDEDTCDNVLNKESLEEIVETVAKNCEQFKVIPEISQIEDILETAVQAKNLENESGLAVRENQEEEYPLTELQEEEMLATVDNVGSNEGNNAELSFVDKEAESDQKEMEEVQYIDEEAGEDQQLLDIMGSLSYPTIDLTQNIEADQANNGEVESEKNELNKDCEIVPAELLNSSTVESQRNEEIDNSKFEEISEGSIDQDHEELAAEAISDAEITVENVVSKKSESKKNINANIRYNEAETLEEVFFATENDDAKITAEDKDNDDISDASLPDHAEANLSLEEISDDDLEPSKKKRKPSGMTPIKTEKVEDSAKSDAENVNKLEEKTEGTKTNQTSSTIQKRPADDTVGCEENLSKRFKVSSEAKGSEGDNTVSLFSASGDIKKEGKKPQKESEGAHSRNTIKRNPSQLSKSEQQENRERPLPSRDVAEHRRRYELVSSSCQTEPRLLKGKIVQCNINPIKSVIKPGLLGIHSEIAETKLLNKFRKKLPSSTPENIFSHVTSLQSPHKANTFSFSMGPVLLSDMDCPKFRDVLRGAEELNLAFDKSGQGIWTASIASSEGLSSLISQLKLLDLGKRYMVMSVAYRHGSEVSAGVWKATIVLVYEQDTPKESKSSVSDEKVRAKLCLKGVPKDITKDFIRLLFPEAIHVGSGPGTFDERVVVLGFPSTKIVEEILSCYNLLLICGSQINISDMDSSEIKQKLPTDAIEKSADLILEDTKLRGEVSDQQHVISVDLELEKDIKQQDGLGPNVDSSAQESEAPTQINDTIQEPAKANSCSSDPNTDGFVVSDPKTDGLAGDLADALSLDQGNNAIDTEGKDPLPADTESCKVVILGDAETNIAEPVRASEPLELAEINASNIQDIITAQPTDEQLTSGPKKDKYKFEGLDVIILDDDDDEDVNLSNSQRPDVSRPSESLACGSANTANITVGEEVSKLETVIDCDTNLEAELQLPKSTETSTEGLEDASEDVIKENVSSTIEVAKDDKRSEKKANVLKKEASNDENLEDVSDDEMMNQSKHEDHEDVVIVKEVSTKWVVANIDLTNEESNASGKVLNENTKDVAEEKSQQVASSAGARKTNSRGVKATSTEKESQNVEPKLVMTDGGLEVLMEVIDVTDGNQEVDKVIYARTWRQSRERNKWDSSSYRPASYVHTTWRDNQWSYASRPDVYNNSQNAYKYYPAKEGTAKIPKHYSGSSREGSPNYRAPSREETSHRRFSYYAKHKRNPSPSPKRDLNFHGHSSSHATDHRGSTTDHWDKRYDNWRPSALGDSRKPESYSRPAAEPSSRPLHVQSRSTAYHSSHAWRESHHDSAKTDDRYSHGNSRGTHYRDRRHDYRKTRSRSYSDLSMSSGEHLPPVRKSSYRRESPRRSTLRVSRSPISVSSRSRSLSPVSKSPSVEYSQAEAGKEELVKTVKHFLELAKGLQQAQKRRSNRSRSPKSPSLRHSKSPVSVRLGSPRISSGQTRKAGRSTRHAELSSPHRRSRSPPVSWSRNSRSPSHARTRRYKYERSPSPSSNGGKYKRHRGDRSYNDRKEKSHRRESVSPAHRYESKKSQRTGDSSKTYEEQGSRSKSGQSSDPKYRSSDQSWQQSSSGYQPPQSSGQSSTSNLYNPAYPPPGMYSSSSVPVYPYSSTSQYNYSSIPPPYVQTVPPPQVSQSYQSSYSTYQPSQSYSTSGHHNAPLTTGTSGGVSSNNTPSKTKKSWSMGNSALAFQRVLGSSKGKKSSK